MYEQSKMTIFDSGISLASGKAKISGIKKPATRTGSVKTYYGLLGKLGIKKPALGGFHKINIIYGQ